MEKFLKKLTIILSGLLVIAIVLTATIVPKSFKNLKDFELYNSGDIANSIKNMELNMTSIIYAKNEEGEWVEYQRIHGEENRIWVSIDKVPQQLIDAFVAIEDQRFYEHKGVDWKRTILAVFNKLFKFDDTEFGGSTITQQLIKNITEDKGKTAERKFREIIRALQIEKKVTKTQIMEAYLNTVSLGNGICGVQVAANYYFNKDVSELTLSECASLAAITKNPSRFNPISGFEANDERRRTVLSEMYEMEKIDKDDYTYSYGEKVVVDLSQKNSYEASINNYFIDSLIDQVIEDLSVKNNCSKQEASTMLYNGGYKIYSTIDTDIQTQMEKVYQNIGGYFSQKATNSKNEKVNVQSAMTIMDYNGHIMGIVGGVGQKTENRGLNRATDSPRQPGSTMKPIGVYALAIEKNKVNYTSEVLDEPVKKYYPDGRSGPMEWYGSYKGKIRLNYAIRKSANTIPVRLLKEIGIETSYDFLKNKLNCTYLTEVDKNLASLALGGCQYGITTTQSAAAYAIFGNMGVYHKPTTYYKVESSTGELVLEYNSEGEQVISPATASIMNHLLQEVVYGSEGTGAGIAGYSRMKAFAKTGTSSESNDLWMVAGSPYFVGSVWYGFDDPSVIYNAGAAAKVWRDVMKNVHRQYKVKNFEDSDDVVKIGIGYYKKGQKVTPIYSEAIEEPAPTTPTNPGNNTTTTTPENPTTPTDPNNPTTPTNPENSTTPTT